MPIDRDTAKAIKDALSPLLLEHIAEIKASFDQGMADIREDVREMRTDFKVVQSDVNSMKSDIRAVSVDVTNLKNDLGTLKTDISAINKQINPIQSAVDIINKDVKNATEHNDKDHDKIFGKDGLCDIVSGHTTELLKINTSTKNYIAAAGCLAAVLASVLSWYISYKTMIQSEDSLRLTQKYLIEIQKAQEGNSK